MSESLSAPAVLAGPPPTADELQSLPPGLVPELNREMLSDEERAEWQYMEQFAQANGTDKAAEVGFLLFLEQRRKTRTWVVGSAVAAAALGVLSGYLMGRP
jgi:hypothetical protein